MKTLTKDLTLAEIIEAYSTLGKEGHILTVNLEGLTASCARVSKRARFGQKQVFGYRFRSEERLVEYILDFYNGKVQSSINAEKEKAERKAKDLEARKNVNVGDIFCYSWGWEQTNIDFYQVVVKKGSASVAVRPINHETVEETSWASENCRAVPNSFCGEAETVRLSGAYFKRSCGVACKMEDPTEKRYRSWYA